MKTKTFILRSIVASLVHFFAGYLLYAVLFASYFGKYTTPSALVASRAAGSELVGYIFLSCLCYGVLLSYFFTKSNSQSLKSGLIIGAIMGCLYAAAVNANLYATTTILTSEVIILDIILYTFMSMVMSAAISLIGKPKKSATTAL
jgi:hypothetical protein